MRSGRACIHDRRYSLGHTVRIGGNSERSDSVIDVDVNVDKAGSNDLPFRVQNLAGFAFRNTGAHVRDTPPSNGNVPIVEQVLRRIDDPPTPDEQIVPGGARVRLSREHSFARGGKAAQQAAGDRGAPEKAAARGGISILHSGMILSSTASHQTGPPANWPTPARLLAPAGNRPRSSGESHR